MMLCQRNSTSNFLACIFTILLCVSFHQLNAMDGPTDSDDDEQFHKKLLEHLQSEPLLAAAEKNDVALVRALLTQGATANVQSYYNESTPLHAACLCVQDTQELVSLLLEHNADPMLTDTNLNTPAHFAACRNKVKELELLKKKGSLLDTQNNVGFTPCHIAVRADALETLAWLGTSGANMNVLDANGEAPIHHAVRKGNSKTVHQLLSHGAHPYLASGAAKERAIIVQGSTPFHLAAAHPAPQSYTLKSILLYYALFYQSNFEKTGAFETHSLNPRIKKLEEVLNQKDIKGRTPVTIQASNASLQEKLPLFKDAISLDVFNFGQALQTKTIDALSNTNILKAAYLVMKERKEQQAWSCAIQ